MKKYIALFLIFSILTLSGNLYAEKKGADLIVQKVDRIRVKGELIAVKQDSILLLDKYSGADMAIDVRDIDVIKIVRESGAPVVGGIAGLFLGGVTGYFIGYPQGDDGGFVIISKPLAGGIGAAIGGILGVLVGAGIGLAVEADKTIQFKGKSDSEVQEILEELRKKARVRNYQ